MQDREKLTELLIKSPQSRMELAEKSLAYFTFIYLGHYIKAQVPDFHYEIYEELEKKDAGITEIVAFRGSAKSTISSLALPLWNAIFKKKNFIILISDTHTQSKQIISNLIYELENNTLLRHDFGEFRSKKDEWTATNIFLRGSIRIMSRSRGQKMRGLRHLQHRPDLVICDDMENIDAVRSKEQRDKTENWFFSECWPAVDARNGKVVVLGNLLHADSFVSRLRKKVNTLRNGKYLEYPLLNDEKVNLWPEEYDDEKIEELRKRGNSYFMREYCLVILPDEGQIIKRVDYYDELPELRKISIAADLAISQSDSADYTSVHVSGMGVDKKFYNLRNIAGRWNFNEALNQIHKIYEETRKAYPSISIVLGIEEVAYQKAAIEEFQRRFGISVKGVKQTTDKRARLETFLPYLENEQILFKKEGLEDLIIELLGFGVEKHDDRVDAAEMSWRLLIETPSIGMAWG